MYGYTGTYDVIRDHFQLDYLWLKLGDATITPEVIIIISHFILEKIYTKTIARYRDYKDSQTPNPSDNNRTKRTQTLLQR